MIVDVGLENLTVLTEYVEDTLTQADAPMDVVIKMSIALDEIFSNIVNYSGASYAKVECRVENSTAFLDFEDDGVAYDPLKKEDPNITLSADERDIGGLGIFMVKQSMTRMCYDYAAGKNTLALELDFQPSTV